MFDVFRTSAGYTRTIHTYDRSYSRIHLQHILLFKELEFSLKEIKDILDSPDFDRSKALEQQIHLLELRKEHLQNLIDLAWGIKGIGVKNMSFDAFDTRKIDEYAEQAKKIPRPVFLVDSICDADNTRGGCYAFLNGKTVCEVPMGQDGYLLVRV